MRDFFDPIEPAQVNWNGPVPYAVAFGDGYFGHGDGLAESQTVFIEGNRLMERFAALPNDGVFVIGETGFGTGLNALLAAERFATHAPKGARLEIVSVDLHPLKHDDLARAVAQWPALQSWSDSLMAQYPAPGPGHHRVALGDRILLTLVWGDATALFQQSNALVDAWFLDGFAPAKNPTMWTSALFKALKDRSVPGATLATFSAAGEVRRGLADAGFIVKRCSGFGDKKHRIEGINPGTHTPRRQRGGHAVVAGAGLAGATTARALAQRGWTVSVCDPNGPASGGSGNLAGVVYATPSPHLQSQNRFYLNALIRALAWFRRLGFPDDPDHGQLNDVMLHLKQDRRRKNAHQAHATGAWPEALLALIDDQTACLKGAGYIHPKAWIERLLDHPQIAYQATAITSLEAGDSDALILANAHGVTAYPALADLPLRTIRGQVTEIEAGPEHDRLTRAHCHLGYVTPALAGRHCVGATYDLHNQHVTSVAADDQHNIEQLKVHLPDIWQTLGGESMRVVGHRSAFRCTTPDRLPLVGPVPALGEHVYLNVGHGSRGITHTPMCADLLADHIGESIHLGGAAMDPQMIKALSPMRYLDRVA